jgi:hypothetical protein
MEKLERKRIIRRKRKVKDEGINDEEDKSYRCLGV